MKRGDSMEQCMTYRTNKVGQHNSWAFLKGNIEQSADKDISLLEHFTSKNIWVFPMGINVVIIPKVYIVPEAKQRDNNIPRVLLLLVNDSPNLLVPKAKPRNTKNISYYYYYSTNMPNHLLMFICHP